MCGSRRVPPPGAPSPLKNAMAAATSWPARFGWHYLSDATSLIRPHSFCVFLVVSTITMLCYIIRHV